MKIELDMYQTLALAVLVLMLGKFLRERVVCRFHLHLLCDRRGRVCL